MNFKNKMMFVILSFAIATLMLSASNNIQQQTFISTFAEKENEAEVEADIEQENKCKDDTECENENELNNELSIVNKTGTETGTGQLTVIKEVTCQDVSGNGFTHTVLQDQPVISKIQYVPVGEPCFDSEITSQIEPQDFEFTVTGNNPNPTTFQGSSSGVVVTLGAGSYDVEETDNVPSNLGPFTVNIDTTETGDCSGTISAGESKTCTFTNDIILVFETQP
ncbi:MAG: hypothetical protein DA328_06635 [Nitrososphaeraceae archaeon]|nr:hypothetical protein [Nitrososphaeraceae archaeon]